MKTYLTFTDRNHFTTYLTEQKGEMYDIIWNAIHEAYENGENTADILEIHLKEEDTCIEMVSEDDDWVNSLQLALVYYVETEDYSTCSKINALISKLQI